ncbi:protein white-like isoform X2 [Spodoptera litura]|uniref:Protein white-like isoform X2 n=1 Tax=Spodoptera litura TaxID=69820 RepID=A0A9J7IN70_SPOLT|nr:protein white-like isoform X2 [Spodoptera litura]
MESHDKESMENDVVIKIKGLKVWTPEEKSWWRRKPTKPQNVILNNVTGNIRRSEFAAVIGPSGAGKTTFLVSLAGKCTLPSEGSVTLYGQNVKACPGAVEIAPQHEAFMDGLSVMEHLVFMTEMRLGSCKDLRIRSTLNSIVEEFKLKPHVNTPVGGLSGGERRLLSLATTFLSDPQILLCDEPTTGLDSYNALLVIGVLKKLSASGRIVICSVHQPSCDLFKEFSSVLLMAEGRLLFHGSQDECKDVFESIGLLCPLNYNPAEFYIRAVSSSGNVHRLVEISQNRLEYNGTSSIRPDLVHTYNRPVQRNWFKQVHLLLWRLSLTLKRELRNQILQLFITVVITSMVLGVAYVGATGTTQRGVQEIRGFLWLLTSEVSFGVSYSALYAFEYEISLFKREVGVYKCSAYFVSRFLSFIPRCIIWPVVLVSISSLAVDLPNHVITTLEFIVLLVVSAIPAVAYGLGMAALFTSTGIIGDVMPCVDLPLFLMSGAFLRISSLPPWMFPIKYISHFYYTMDAISNVYWRQIDFIDCPTNETSTCVKDGATVLLENGYVNNFILQDSLGFVLITLIWCLLGYLGLKREEKKGYAY